MMFRYRRNTTGRVQFPTVIDRPTLQIVEGRVKEAGCTGNPAAKSRSLTLPTPSMTHRKLFRHLLIGSTVALVAGWWFSLGSVFSLSCQVPGCHFSTVLYRGSISNQSTAYGSGAHYDFNVGSVPAASLDPQTRDSPNPMGSWSMGSISDRTLKIHYLVFPIWLPYLVLVGCAFAGAKWLGRRAASGEKELALQGADGQGPGRSPTPPRA